MGGRSGIGSTLHQIPRPDEYDFLRIHTELNNERWRDGNWTHGTKYQHTHTHMAEHGVRRICIALGELYTKDV